MDLSTAGNKLVLALKKYKYIVFVIIIGVVLLLLPTQKTNKKTENTMVVNNTPYSDTVNKDLKTILSKVKGAGKIELYLMTAEGEETIYQSDSDQADDSTGKTKHSQTVIITDSQRNEYGLIKKIIAPKYNGAIIVCEGADNAEVRLHLIQAVANVTGLGTNKISVLKMK